jgi:ferrous iron transport protein B
MSAILELPIQPIEPPALPMRPLTIAIAGNPNAGKTTLFNAITGLRQKVANYPGVTVESKAGRWMLRPEGLPARLVDLPGLYSLDAASPDEQIARDILLGEELKANSPDVIVAVVDATNLARNLYFVTQLIETGRPLVIALTMTDLAERQQLRIDVDKLSDSLGAAVVPVNARQRCGIDALARAVLDAAMEGQTPSAGWPLSSAAESELACLAAIEYGDRYAAMRDLYTEELPEIEKRREMIKGARQRLAAANPRWWQEPLIARYNWIEGVIAETVHHERDGRPTITDRIDALVTHRILGPAILLLVMVLVFQAIFSWANLPMNLIDHVFSALGATVRAHFPAGIFTDLLVDGIIAGVGGVLAFLPQIMLLFFFISILEDSGYMARAAFLMDRLMRAVGLHGKAFVPLLSSFACAVPGIMATRTIENPKDRLATIMVAPFMSCSARLPVYTLMIAALFSGQRVMGTVSLGVVIILAMYLLGITVAIVVAWILKRTILSAPPPPFVMELPPYRVPSLRNVGQTILTRAGVFMKRAGTVILAISILLWVLVAFPRSETKLRGGAGILPASSQPTASREAAQTQMAAKASDAFETKDAGRMPALPAVNESGAATKSILPANASSEQVQNSFAGRAGRLIEPLIAPLGFDWKIGIGLISAFAARETIVSTLSIVYNVGKSPESKSTSLVGAIRDAKRPDGSPVWTPLVALSLMVFFVLACQCMSTVAIVRRETNSWRWPIFMVAYMLVLAYLGSFITYQGGHLLGFS